MRIGLTALREQPDKPAQARNACLWGLRHYSPGIEPIEPDCNGSGKPEYLKKELRERTEARPRNPLGS